MFDSLEARTWFRLKNLIGIDVRLFLFRVPFTFGHSELVIKFRSRNCHRESDRFHYAACLIERAIVVFNQVLIPSIIKKFKPYAKITFTKGKYIKTLILRVSADEKSNVYKVHLIPYFESHAEACQKRFTSIHSVSPKEKGGLIGWLGERDNIIDSWQIIDDNPFGCGVDDIVCHHWNLPDLAEILSKEWEKI